MTAQMRSLRKRVTGAVSVERCVDMAILLARGVADRGERIGAGRPAELGTMLSELPAGRPV
ncbi:hypothetical protein GCM10027514_39440 [Azotobacter armeniacus]